MNLTYMKCKIRAPQPTDIPFIYASMLNCLRFDSYVGRNMKSSHFYEDYCRVIDYILQHSKILIAADLEDPTVIYSYLIYEPNTVHFAFTKEAFRRLGLHNTLMNAAALTKNATATHRTNSTKWLPYNYRPTKLYTQEKEYNGN